MIEKVNKLVFFNSSSEVDDYLLSHSNSSKDTSCLYITMNPLTRAYAKQRNIEILVFILQVIHIRRHWRALLRLWIG